VRFCVEFFDMLKDELDFGLNWEIVGHIPLYLVVALDFILVFKRLRKKAKIIV